MTLNDRIKNELGYRWCDETLSARLDSIIAQSKSYLLRYDPKADFENDEFAFSLLIECSRYKLANAMDDFGKNYFEEILSFHHRYLAREEREEDA